MADRSNEWHEQTVRLDGTELFVIKGGAGKPMLVLHDELGHPGWLKWHSALAKNRSLLIPLHPGFGRTERAEWMLSIRDMAGFYSRYVKEQGMAPLDVIGFSIGGWIAAEMAVSNPTQFRRMILVGPGGLKPPRGDILDFFQMMAPQQLLASVLDPNTPEFGELYGGAPTPEQFEAFEEARAQTARLAWTPYMHNPTLAHHLPLAAGLPTLIVWGKQDAVVPLSAGELYRESIPGSRLVTFDKCGHRPEIEKSAEFIREVESFLG